jgi:hypothetical protein
MDRSAGNRIVVRDCDRLQHHLQQGVETTPVAGHQGRDALESGQLIAYFRPWRTAFQSEGGHDFKLKADSVSDDRGHRFKVKADSISS